jgi:hypothetical protein
MVNKKGERETRETYNMLGFNELNELRILGVINVCAERDILNGHFSWDGCAFERREFFRFSQDVLWEADKFAIRNHKKSILRKWTNSSGQKKF